MSLIADITGGFKRIARQCRSQATKNTLMSPITDIFLCAPRDADGDVAFAEPLLRTRTELLPKDLKGIGAGYAVHHPIGISSRRILACVGTASASASRTTGATRPGGRRS
jgi:hypothetical protein